MAFEPRKPCSRSDTFLHYRGSKVGNSEGLLGPGNGIFYMAFEPREPCSESFIVLLIGGLKTIILKGFWALFLLLGTPQTGHSEGLLDPKSTFLIANTYAKDHNKPQIL